MLVEIGSLSPTLGVSCKVHLVGREGINEAVHLMPGFSGVHGLFLYILSISKFRLLLLSELRRTGIQVKV